MDGSVADAGYPRHVPLVRMSIPAATERMGEFVAWAALSLLKDARRMAIAQGERRWDEFVDRIGQTLANHAIVPVSSRGFDIFTQTPLHAIADISQAVGSDWGDFLPSAPANA